VGFLADGEGMNEDHASPQLRRIPVAMTAAFLIAAVVMVIITQTRQLILSVSEIGTESVSAATSIVDAGLRAALAGMLIVIAAVVIPMLWRASHHPRTLRILAFTGSQLPAVSIGLLPSDAVIGGAVGFVASAVAATWWLVWNTKWQGTGVAPSLLTGVLKPRIHPGQIWFAYIAGHQVGKIRPVVVLAPASGSSFTVAYFTSQQPKPHLQSKYIAAPDGSLRGLSGENYVEVHDIRELSVKKFRKYVGLAPRWLYDQITTHGPGGRAADALLLDEVRAGEHMGPFEQAIHHAAGRSKRHRVENDYAWDALRRFFRMQVPTRKNTRS